MLAVVLAAALLVVASGQVFAADTTLGFNVSGSWETPHLFPGETADGFSNWTNAENNNGTGLTLSGSDSLVSCSWSSGNLWAGGEELTSEQQLYRVYLDDGSGISATISGLGNWLTSIGATGYTIRIYQNSDWDSGHVPQAQFKPIDIMDGVTVLQTVQSTNMWFTDGGTRAFVDSGILTSTGTITLNLQARDLDNGYRSTLAGFKITAIPEPATMILLGLGGLMLRRKHA
jgi:hypothetical protein